MVTKTDKKDSKVHIMYQFQSYMISHQNDPSTTRPACVRALLKKTKYFNNQCPLWERQVKYPHVAGNLGEKIVHVTRELILHNFVNVRNHSH